MMRSGRPVPAGCRPGRQLGAGARGALAMVAASAVLALAACGSAAAGGHAGAPSTTQSARAGVALCAAARGVDRLTVSLVSPLPASPYRLFLPRTFTISDPPRVRPLAAALCALPPLPRGMRCLARPKYAVRLVFAAGRSSFHPVLVQVGGCRRVTGAGPARSWSQSPRFGRLLIRTLGSKGRLVPVHGGGGPTP